MSLLTNPFSVDGVTLPVPDEYRPSVEDLSSEATGRTLDGVMHKDVVAVKDNYEFVWHKASWTDAATIFNAIDGKTQVTLTYVDPRKPYQVLSNLFYVGQRSCEALNLNDPVFTWKNISLTFTRV